MSTQLQDPVHAVREEAGGEVRPKVRPKGRRRARPARRREGLTARGADKHRLYERAVQETSIDVALVERVFRRRHGRSPLHLREDFCGTAALCADWVRRRRGRTALGVDLDGEVLEWGRRNHLAGLGEAASRVTLLQRNVLEVTRPKVEVVVAFNFSYSVLQERRELLDYFRAVRRSLAPGGLFMLDNHAGSDTLSETEDERDCEGFTYVWEQGAVNGVDNCGVRRIHFRFPDGSEMRNAFVYDWRVWSLAELRDVAADAGFAATEVYAEHFDEDGEPTTGIRRVTRYPHERSWTPYLACWR